MKKVTILLYCIAVVLAFSTYAMAQCVTIQDGIYYQAGRYLQNQPVPLGFDPFGYNYQAHIFSGSYANAYLNVDGLPPYGGDDASYYQRLVDESKAPDIAAAQTLMNSKWYWPYRSIDLVMKWNDAWLSNKDCNGDGLLDRYFGYPSYIGSGAWETNHQKGTYELDGKICRWSYFVKIVAVPSDAHLESGIWYTASETEIGSVIWGEFAIIEQIENDKCAGLHGAAYISPAGPGFGKWADDQ